MKALCRYYGTCSGCTLQHFPYVKQLHDKNRELKHSLESLLRRPHEDQARLQDLVSSPMPFGYRISSKLCLHEDEIGRRSLGLYQRGSKKVTDIPSCPVHHPEINKLLTRLFQGGLRTPALFYNHSKKAFQSARLKFITIRFCPTTNEFGVVLSHTGVPRALLETWTAQLQLSQVSFYESILSKSDDDLILSRQVNHLSGPTSFAFVVAGQEFRLNPLAFFQANFSLTEQFVEHITGDLQGDTLLDLYGGFGAYSFAAARRFKKIYLVEANEHAIAAARLAASTNKDLEVKIRPQLVSVEDFLASFQKPLETQKVSHIIVNPPRSGLSPQVKSALLKGRFSQLKELVYVSCHLETLRRDLQALGGSLQVKSITPFDMFPQTAHVELVAKLLVKPRPLQLTKLA